MKKSTLKNLLIFSQKKVVFMFWEKELSSSKIKKISYIFSKTGFLLFQEMDFLALEKVHIFSRKIFFLYFGKLNFLKKFIIFQEGTFRAWKIKKAYSENNFYFLGNGTF